MFKMAATTLNSSNNFEQLQHQVQDLLDHNPSDDRLLSESQLTQIKSLVQATINETIDQTAAAAAQAAVTAFSGSSCQSQAAACEVSPSTSNTLPSAVQESLNSLAVHGASKTVTSINPSTFQRT